MIDLASDPSSPRDLDELFDCLEETVTFVAEMRDVHTTRRFGQRRQLVRRRERPRRVDERRAEAERAARRGVARKPAHAFELPACRGTIVVPDLVYAKRGRTDERRHVDRNAKAHEMIEALSKSGPWDVVLDIRLAFDLIAAHRIGQRTHRRAFTENLERDALVNIALGSAIRDQRRDRPRKHVDEAGRDGEP